MEKQLVESVAIVIYDDKHENVLAVKRPLDDESNPGVWGFPATTRTNPEISWEGLVMIAAKTKLGVDVEIVKLIGEDTGDRGHYILTLRDYECKIISGQPSVPQPEDGHTQYIEMKYTHDFEPFKISVRSGSLCTKIFLEDKGIEVN